MEYKTTVRPRWGPADIREISRLVVAFIEQINEKLISMNLSVIFSRHFSTCVMHVLSHDYLANDFYALREKTWRKELRVTINKQWKSPT